MMQNLFYSTVTSEGFFLQKLGVCHRNKSKYVINDFFLMNLIFSVIFF